MYGTKLPAASHIEGKVWHEIAVERVKIDMVVEVYIYDTAMHISGTAKPLHLCSNLIERIAVWSESCLNLFDIFLQIGSVVFQPMKYIELLPTAQQI